MNHHSLFVEALEPRVAPAILVNGGNLLGGKGSPTTGETSSGGNTVTLIKVLSGQALVFYDAGTTDITGISISKHTRLDITGNITGDIVTNLLPNGRLTDSDNNPANGEDGGILLPYAIKGITTHPLDTENGDIGRIIAGGTVNNVNISGSLSGVYAGNGIFRDGSTATVDVGSVDYNTIAPDVQHIFTLTQANAKSNAQANISNVVVHTANQLEIFAGSGADNAGALGGAGGSITNVTIVKTLAGQGAKPALFLHSGDGGAGTTGGAGGGITNFDDQNSIAYVKIQTGDGGAASAGLGGVGGSLVNTTITTSSPRYDLLMGHGGDGVTGGRGGNISNLVFNNNVLGGRSLIATGDFNNDGIQDVLLINTVTGEGTLSLGVAGTATPFTIALQPLVNADGTTGTTPFIAAEGAVPTGLVATDLNGDGFIDFVVSYASTNNLGVFLNHGDGTFTASSVALPASPTAIALGHFTGTTLPSIAVLSGGDVASVNGGQNSQVFVAQDSAAGVLGVLPNPVLVTGVGTDIAAADIDGMGGTDAYVGLASGSITPLISTLTSFTPATPIPVFKGVPVDNIDVSAASGSLLLAFSKNTVPVTDTSSSAVIPEVALVTVQSDATGGVSQTFFPDASAVRAHFVQGTDVVGVVTPSSVLLYQNSGMGYAVTATLASDGQLNDFQGSIVDGNYQVIAVGAATNRFFYTTGTLDETNGLPAFKHYNLPYEERIISFTSGDGGAGTTHDGGTGGSIKGLTYTQKLGQGVIQAGGGYNTFITTGDGGTSAGGTGGRGGDMTGVSLSLNPGYLNDGQDDTDFALIRTGDGGSGAAGGAGGGIVKTVSNSVFSVIDGQISLGSVAVQIEGGNGGAGTATTGGDGGFITLNGPGALSGVTFYDFDGKTPEAPALFVEAGNGGAGVTAGGIGGTVTNVGSQNAITAGFDLARNELGSANIVAGAGGNATHGNGGGGGTVAGLNVGVQSYGGTDGWIAASGGAGGDSTNGHGGAGGSVVKSTAISADGDTNRNFGVLVNGGDGGNGTSGGGGGGGIKLLTVSTPSSTDLYAGVVAAGDGGNASIDGAGGAGGSVKGVTQTKDVNSAITAILGGSGGTSKAGTGGAGGSVKNVDTVGFIGLPTSATAPLGVFDPGISSPDLEQFFADGKVTQGIYAGRGAGGSSNGSVHSVVARQIAAIGAVVDDQGLFGVAAAVTKITADLIGYEVTRDNIFESTAPGSVSPAAAVPVDGFILAATTSGITTLDPDRTTAFTFHG